MGFIWLLFLCFVSSKFLFQLPIAPAKGLVVVVATQAPPVATPRNFNPIRRELPAAVAALRGCEGVKQYTLCWIGIVFVLCISVASNLGSICIEMDGADEGEQAPQQEEFLTQEKTAEARRFDHAILVSQSQATRCFQYAITASLVLLARSSAAHLVCSRKTVSSAATTSARYTPLPRASVFLSYFSWRAYPIVHASSFQFFFARCLRRRLITLQVLRAIGVNPTEVRSPPCPLLHPPHPLWPLA